MCKVLCPSWCTAWLAIEDESMRRKNLCAPAGEQRELSGESSQGAAGAADGRHHGAVLPGVLAALRSRGPAVHLQARRDAQPRGQHRALAAGQVLHRGQPLHIHLHEQTGELVSLQSCTNHFQRFRFLLRPWGFLGKCSTLTVYVH